MYLKRLKDGTLAAWVACVVNISNGRTAYSLHPRASAAVEAMHRAQGRSTVTYAYLSTGRDLESLLDMKEACHEARYREEAFA